MFKSILVYRIQQWEQPPLARIEPKLQGSRFVPCTASQSESVGWIEPRGEPNGPMIETTGGTLILRFVTETKAVPSQVVSREVQAKLNAIEKETGRRPKGKIVKELKEEVLRGLLPRAFPKRSETAVWIDPKSKRVVIGGTNVRKADPIISELVELLGGGLKVSLVQTSASPASAMAVWLASKEAPKGFTIDRECELKQPDTQKASVRYARHTLEIDEVGEHIRQGKLPKQLAMTWAGRVSFVLTEGLALKKLELLDVVLEGAAATAAEGASFDADAALFTGELRGLIADLIEALGGLQESGGTGLAGGAANAEHSANHKGHAEAAQPA